LGNRSGTTARLPSSLPAPAISPTSPSTSRPFDELAYDHIPLDLVGPLANDHQWCVAKVALDVDVGGRSRREPASRPA
jgi:hypothetical protein